MAGHTFQLHRGDAKWYSSRADYLAQRGGPETNLCQTMVKAVAEAALSKPGPANSRFNGVPWLTPVIGSGCLEIGATDEVTPEQLAALVGSAAERLHGVKDSIHDQAGLATRFALELARDRMAAEEDDNERESRPLVGSSNPAMTVEPRTARITIVAALVSQIFYMSKAHSASPIKRWESDTAVLQKASFVGTEGARTKTLKSLCIDHLYDAAKEFHRDKAGSLSPAVCEAVQRLVARLRVQLEPRDGCITLANLKLVTEAAWYLIASSTDLYPGWTDLLFKLMLGDSNSDGETSRPYIVDQSHIGDRVQQLFVEPSQRSWESWADARRSRTSSRREDFYRSVADVLWAQTRAALNSDVRQGQKNLPIASAFVMSFDLEVEMAVWSQADHGQSYYVLLPVHVQDRRGSAEAKMCWLRARFDKDLNVGPDDFKALRTASDWEMVDAKTDVLTAPHIVHLSGCPLLHLPERGDDGGLLYGKLAEALGDSELDLDPAVLELSHAVTIDEYLALQQAESELVYAVMSKMNTNTPSDSLALPIILVSSNTDTKTVSANPRFWLALGVPVADPAIRSRVITQLTVTNVLAKASIGESRSVESHRSFHAQVDPEESRAAQAASPSKYGNMIGPIGSPPLPEPGTEETPSSGRAGRLAGLVVNRRISRDDGGVLYWLGLQVVSDIAESFIGDLDHYSEHLRPEHEHHRILLTGRCSVGEDVR